MGTTFDSLAAVRPHLIWTGARARAVEGGRITLAVVDLDPSSEVPEHSHDNEQVGLVLKGAITMRVAGEARLLGPGETYVIPGGVPHSAAAGPAGASVVDTFSPVRADWAQVERGEPSPGMWPG
ncbi:MAG: cupin domain-containing protein [Candidatus Dormibacteraeota bacterium]|nr:cupin domain-containing protein [Candidatus Dormibacteraeota bacterium]